jgi:hypothetical protein
VRRVEEQCVDQRRQQRRAGHRLGLVRVGDAEAAQRAEEARGERGEDGGEAAAEEVGLVRQDVGQQRIAELELLVVLVLAEDQRAELGDDLVRVISDCHFAVQLTRFIPGFLSYLVAVFL